MKLSSVIIIAIFVVVVVGLPSRKTASETSKLLEKLGVSREAIPQEMARACSKQIGEKCEHDCQCCGATVVCGTIYVGGNAVEQCMSKTSNNAVLNTMGHGMNAVQNAFTSVMCWG
uniref:Putative mature sequence toxin-like ACSKQ n=1 Tax=Pelinobius muticus TaxID=753628 RepID=D5J6X8_PELMU|nr:putative mature sequence toxin-like ACSKQ [Pelinobius muticus]